MSCVWVEFLFGRKCARFHSKIPETVWKLVWKSRSLAFSPLCAVKQLGDLEHVSVPLLVPKPEVGLKPLEENFLFWVVESPNFEGLRAFREISAFWIFLFVVNYTKELCNLFDKDKPHSKQSPVSLSLFYMFKFPSKILVDMRSPKTAGLREKSGLREKTLPPPLIYCGALVKLSPFSDSACLHL